MRHDKLLKYANVTVVPLGNLGSERDEVSNATVYKTEARLPRPAKRFNRSIVTPGKPVMVMSPGDTSQSTSSNETYTIPIEQYVTFALIA